MKVIRPTTIDGSRLTSSTVPETDAAVWSSATTYALGAKVIRTTAATHRIYQSLTASNLNQIPESSPLAWLDIGPTNRFAMFDTSSSTQTALANTFTVVLTPGAIDSIGFVNLAANSVTVTMTNSGVTVYDKTVNLDLATIADWYEYFFEPFKFKTEFALHDLPQYPGCVLTVTINNGSLTAKCGALVVGTFKELGAAQWAPKVSIADYSRKEIDDFGQVTLIKRGFSRRLESAIFVENGAVDGVISTLADLRATPAYYSITGDFDNTSLFGYYRDFSVTIDSPAGSTCTITLEGLI